METIRIPHVSLVDATGRRIGVYTDDPDWWQQLKLKHQNNNRANAQILDDLDAQPPRHSTPITLVENDSNNNGSRIKLIRDDHDLPRVSAMKTDSPAFSQLTHRAQFDQNLNLDDFQRQCNVIGETPLHIAIMFDDFATVKFLIEKKGFNVNQRCVGGKFTGGFNSKLTTNLIQQSKYESLAYYGEYPLAFAACFASKEIYDYLISKGADPNLQGTKNNNYT